jgi:hypothetical protein
MSLRAGYELADSSSYYILLHIESDTPSTGFNTRYRFTMKYLAQQFMQYIYTLDNVMSSDMIYFETVYLPAFSRPKYDRLDPAIEDVIDCIYYCHNYSTYDTYKYKYTVNEEHIETFVILQLRKKLQQSDPKN